MLEPPKRIKIAIDMITIKTLMLSVIVAAFTLALLSCSENAEKSDESLVSNTGTTPCPTVNIDSLTTAIRAQVRQEEKKPLYSYPHNNSGANKINVTFSEESYIFSKPDTNSEVLAKLPFNSIVSRIEEIKTENTQEYWWIAVMHPNDESKYGYIREKDLADYREKYYGSSYAFLVGESDTIIGGYKQRIVEIKRFSTKDNKMLERYKTTYKESGYRFHRIYNSTLKGTNPNNKENPRALFIYETFRQSCPGGGLKEFIIDDGNKLKLLTKVGSEGEGGYYDQSTAYIPMRFGNGKVLLVGDADVQNIFNWSKADLNVFPYQSKYNVPIENIVVIEDETNGYNSPDLDWEQDPEKAKVTTKSTIYEWDGEKLIKILETN